MGETLDPSLHPFRDDLAAAYLEGRVRAARFAAGEAVRVAVGVLPVRRAPDSGAMRVTELLFGEAAMVYERRPDGWAWVQNLTDGYVGYVRADGLAPPLEAAPTHRVAALGAFLLEGPDLKGPVRDRLSLGALVAVEAAEGVWRRIAGGGWLAAAALAPLDEMAPDWTATALRFLGVPYLWGGRSSLGLDCSALVQLSLAAAGRPAPRDTGMQEPVLGVAVDWAADRMAGLERGDLVYFPGHVGIMVDDRNLLHANATAMAVGIDALDAVEGGVRRSESRGRGVTSVRRLPASRGG